MSTLTLEGLNARLKNLEDIEEIRTLRMTYHTFINDRMFDRFPEIFTADALVDFGHIGKAKGTNEIRELFFAIRDGVDVVKQFIHNHMVTVDGDDATGLSYLDARYARDGVSVMVAARFNERYRRTPRGWKIAEMVVSLYFAAPLDKGWAAPQLDSIKPFK